MADDSNLFDLEIVTPDRVFYKGKVSMVEFTDQDGDIGVYKHHIPLTTGVVPGVLTITVDGVKKEADLMAGFAEILPDQVRILAEVAEWPDEIDEERAVAAKERAEKRISSHSSEVEMIRAELALQRAIVRLSVKSHK
ncbi:ATP synthase epsilon chain [Clostridia bacterium]|nr:ATP synthase epsilon chain [Clostridia bacterium]